MTIQAVLWRVVLCIGVILNGSALASTSMSMPMPMSMQSSMHQHALDRMAAGANGVSKHAACHEQAAAMAVVAAHPHTPSTPAPGKGRHATPDCCPAGTCGCVGVQSQAGIAITGFDVLAMPAMTSGQARVRHDEPVLPHLIRPPIG